MWSKVAKIVDTYRHAATLAIAGVIALSLTMETQRGWFRLGLGSAIKYFAFVFIIVVVVLAAGFAFFLAIAETKAEAAEREPEPEFPTAIARTVTPVARPVVPAPVQPPAPSQKQSESQREPGDGPSLLH